MATFLTGQTVRLVANVSGDDGPADPATLSLTITLPDDTTVTGVIGDFTKVSTGSYRYDYVPASAGRYSWRIVATVPADAFEGVFDVETAGSHAADPVTLDDAKAELNLTGTVDDAELQRMLNAAIVQIGHVVGPLSVETIVEQHTYPGDVIVPRLRPVVSLTSVAMQWDCGLTSGPDGTWTLVNDVLYWRPATGCYRAQAWLATVTYQAGWNPLPEDLRMAVLELVRWLWATQSGSRIRQDQPPMRGDGESYGPVAYALLPGRVKELVAPYRYGARVG